MDWSAVNWEMVASIASAAAVIVAVVAILQVRNLEKEKAQPSIAVSIDRNAAVPWIYELVVQNLGHTEARDVRISIEKKTDAGQAGTRDAPIIPNVWPVLVPGQVWRSTWGTLDQHGKGTGDDAVADIYQAVVTYKGLKGKDREPTTFDLDWGMFYRRSYMDEKTVHHVALYLADLNKNMKAVLGEMKMQRATIGTLVSRQPKNNEDGAVSG